MRQNALRLPLLFNHWHVAVFTEEGSKLTGARADATFHQDLVATEQMQHLMETDHIDFEDMHFAGDKAGALVRRKFLAWAKAEYGEDLNEATA